MARVKCHKCGRVNEDGQEVCVSCGVGLPKVRLKAKTTRGGGPGPALQFSQGQVVAKRYTVQQLIGRGGMGCIYKVHDNVLGEVVALKTLLPQFVKDKVVVERFFNEAKIARRLAHPGIVRVHDIGSAAGTVYISMEFLAGRSLRDILDNLPLGARMPLGQVLRIFDELCSALEYAHRFTIHRDIKPENVMVMEDGSIKLMDFGISKLMANTRLTGASVVMGTPFYMSPEQLRNSRDVDQRADIYSVGVMLYEVLTGNLPTGVPKPASQLHAAVPPDLDRVIEKCVDPEPANRYQTAPELRAALRPILDRTTEREQATIHREQRTEPPRNRLVGGVLCVGVVFMMLLGLAVAEKTRARLLSDAGGAVASADRGVLAEWRLMGELRTDALRLTDARVRRYPDAQSVLDDAEARWEKAAAEAAAGNLVNAVAEGRDALQCYLGVAMWQPDMAFVPPGMVTLGNRAKSLDAFFIDRTEVTIGDYRAFCGDSGGKFDLPPQIARGIGDRSMLKFPMHYVTGYEAMACAAYRGKKLPTEAQWLRAAYGQDPPAFPWGDKAVVESWMMYLHPVASEEAQADTSPFGCRDMARNVAEWTRTVAGDVNKPLPELGDSLMVCGGNYTETPRPPAQSRVSIPFHQRSATVGFRCVRPVPATLGAMAAKLKELEAAVS